MWDEDLPNELSQSESGLSPWERWDLYLRSNDAYAISLFHAQHIEEIIDTTISSKFRHLNDLEIGGTISVWSRR